MLRKERWSMDVAATVTIPVVLSGELHPPPAVYPRLSAIMQRQLLLTLLLDAIFRIPCTFQFDRAPQAKLSSLCWSMVEGFSWGYLVPPVHQ
jgi:hypothetical protein